MSKLGDLIVRLRLQYDDYKKGLKKADADTKGFAGTLGKIKGVGLAVWGAIGTAVVAFAKKMIESTNRVGDAWARFVAQANAGWTTFVQSISAMRWDNLIGRIKEATSAARELQNALDSEFEVSNSIRLQKSAMAEELAELEILARDQTKTYKERADAAKKYLDMVRPLYEQELQLAKSLEDAQLGKWLAGSGLSDTEQLRKDLRNFLVAYGKDQNLMNSLGIMIDANSRTWTGSTRLAKKQLDGDKNYVDQYRAAAQFVANYEKNNGYGTSIYALATVYEKMRGDADTKPLVDAMIAAGEAAGAFDRETKRMQSALNTSLAQMAQSEAQAEKAFYINGNKPKIWAGKTINDVKKYFSELQLDINKEINQEIANSYDPIDHTFVNIDMSAVDAELEAWLAKWEETVERTKTLNLALEDSIIQATTGGMQAFTDLLMGIEGADATDILAALLQPFANTATQLGSLLLAEGIGIKAFKESLKSLNPAVAIGAGVALIALGAALGSAIKALGGGGSSASPSNGGFNSGGGSSASYSPELTVNIKGKLRGSDIVMSEENTKNKWSI